MDELQRQAYLGAMGFTPWVARRPLPGAMPSPVLAPPVRPEPVVEMPVVRHQAHTAVTPVASRPPLPTLDDAPRAASPPPARQPETATTTGTAPRFTLQAFATPNVWLVLEQEQADAPGFGREAQQLITSLLRIWQVGPGQPRRFLCPPDGRPMPQDQATLALGAFLSGLGRSGARRILLCASESTAALVLPARFQAVQRDQAHWLAVSSLSEMLGAPAEHKRRTWQAMVGAGFHA